jgi:very-short-patch-repair endonuclease
MIEYIVFFGLITVCLVVFVLFLRKPKPEPLIADPERIKCESPIEFRLYDALKAQGEYIRTQVPCGRYSIDIALPAYHMAIECDGKAYHSTPEQKAHDKRKDIYLRKNGWKVLRFSGSRINRDLKGILIRIDKERGTD